MRGAPAVLAFVTACASSPAARPATVTQNASASPSPEGLSPRLAGIPALDDLRARMAAGDPNALTLVGVRLWPAEGARDITGDIAPDERVERAVIVSHPDEDAAVVVVTTCGNASLGALHWDGAQWRAGARIPIVQDLRPGRCGETTIRAQAIRLSSDAPREVAVALVSQDATGESVTGPFLSVYQLVHGGRLATLLANAAFGSMDDETGATTHGEFLVVDDVPAPRDLHVSISPGRPGPGGAPAAEIVRRRYTLRGGRLELAEEHREEAD
jgi:hypothetical protein